MTREEAIKEAYGIPVTKAQHEALQFLIPELAESEDERILNALITHISIYEGDFKTVGVTRLEMLDWLEKQKNSLHISETCKENGDSFTDEDERIRKEIIFLLKHYNSKEELTTKYPIESMIAYLEKQKECSFCDFPKSCADCPKEIQAAIDKEFGIDGRDDNDNPLNGYGDWKKGMVLNGPAIWGLVKLGIELQEEQNPSEFSEDERIRKELIEELKSKLPFCSEEFTKHRIIRQINYLEKQKYEYEVFEPVESTLEYKIGFNAGKESIQKAEWSEEDKTMLERCISKMESIIPVPGNHGLTNMSFEKHTDEKLSAWLKSLPERFNLPQKKEWSEDEIKVLNSIIDDYEKAAKSFCGYDGKLILLKAIRDGEYDL